MFLSKVDDPHKTLQALLDQLYTWQTHRIVKQRKLAWKMLTRSFANWKTGFINILAIRYKHTVGLQLCIGRVFLGAVTTAALSTAKGWIYRWVQRAEFQSDGSST